MMIEFSKTIKGKNKVTAINVSVWKILWEYMFWILGGKPDKHWINQFGDEDETR